MSKFKINDVINTNGIGKQSYDATLQSSIASSINNNCKIIDTKFNNNIWWYKFEGYLNWYSEDSIYLKPGTISDKLTIDDLVEGEIYRINHESNDTYIISTYNGKQDSTRIKGRYISNMNGSWEFRNPSTPSVQNRKITTATSQEKKWLNVCIKQNKFIPQSDLDLYDDVTFELKSVKEDFKLNHWYRHKKGFPYLKILKVDGAHQYADVIYSCTTFRANSCSARDILNQYTLLTDLTEIQQYLPEGHADKIKTTTMKRPNLKKEDLKEGDKLKVISLEASNADWNGIGRITPHFSLGDTVKVTEISPYHTGIKIGSSWYPPCMFEKVEEESISMFKKGDYIIFTESKQKSNNSFPLNYVFKQRIDSNFLNPEIDGKGSTDNGWEYYRNYNKNFKNDPNYKSEWRYATTEEIAEYDRLGKPYDVTTLKSKPIEEDLTGRYLKVLKDNPYGTSYKKDSYIKLISKFTCEKGNSYSGCIENGNLTKYGFELMPKGWTPESKEEFIKLDDSHVGKYVSLKWEGIFYPECLVVKEKDRILLCNNHRSNADSHLDKSVYKYSLCYYNWESLNYNCSKIKLLSKSSESKVKEWIPQIGDYLYLINGDAKSAKVGSIAQVTKAPFNDSFFTDKKGVKVKWIKYVPETSVQQDGEYYFNDFRKALPHEIPTTTSKEPDKDELLRIAKEKYPVGTYVFDLTTHTKEYIDSSRFKFVEHDDNIIICDSQSETRVYKKGQWAEIISTSKQEVKSESMEEKWKVGGWVKCIESGRFGMTSYTKGKYYQIISESTTVEVLGDNNMSTRLLKGVECEWVGMDKPYTDSDSLAKSITVNPEGAIDTSFRFTPGKSESFLGYGIPPLPDKWCIERNSSNSERVNAWFKANCWTGEGNPPSLERLFICKSDNNNRYGFDASSYPPSGYTVITQEQFDYWVLGNKSVYQKVSEHFETKYPLTPDECYTTEIKNKPKGFNEEEFNSNPFNQVLVLPKKSKKSKKQLILT